MLTACFSIFYAMGWLFAWDVSSARAATPIYVRPAGHDTSCNGTADVDYSLAIAPNCAVATVARGVFLVDVGGTIQVAAGSYNERVTISKSLTLQDDVDGGSILDGNNKSASGGIGITIAAGVDNVSIYDLKVTEYESGIRRNANGANITEDITFEDVDCSNNFGAGIYFLGNAKAKDITFTRITANDITGTSGAGGRGIFMQSHDKENIIVQDGTFLRNRIAGIDLNLGYTDAIRLDLDGFRITGNTISGGAGVGEATDAAISVYGAIQSSTYASEISDNTIILFGRFGIELKNSMGNGADSGIGSIVIKNNTISQGGGPYNGSGGLEIRDIAGIAVYERTATFAAPSEPTSGIVVTNNTVSGIVQVNSSSFTGFGIVAGGNNQILTHNTVSTCGVGVQLQQGHNQNQDNPDDDYFGRDRSAVTSGIIHGNTITSNAIGFRNLAATTTVKGNTLDQNPIALSQIDGNITAYANNFSNFLTGFDTESGTSIIRHNWWGSTFTQPTGVDDLSWATRLGAPVEAWAEGVNATSLGDASLGGGTGTAVIVSHGRDDGSLTNAPFGNGVTPHVNNLCSPFYDFFVIGSSDTWNISVPVDARSECDATFTQNALFSIPAGSDYATACQPANNTNCWQAVSDVTGNGRHLEISGVSAAALGGTQFVAGDPGTNDPTAVTLIRFRAGSEQLPPWFASFAAVLFLLIGTVVLITRRQRA